jgi:hypothetical protein
MSCVSRLNGPAEAGAPFSDGRSNLESQHFAGGLAAGDGGGGILEDEFHRLGG